MALHRRAAKRDQSDAVKRLELACRIALTFCDQIRSGLLPPDIIRDDAEKLDARLREALDQ